MLQCASRVSGGEQFNDRQPVTHGIPLVSYEHSPNLECRSAPSASRPVKVPGTFHLEVRVKNEVVVKVNKDVLASCFY
jgi:hypothetical protein